jgi:penicillin-binding protein 1B
MAKRSRAKKRRWFWGITLGVALLALLSVALYVLHLDRLVTRQFEGRRWTLPARVYASPLELYTGLALPAKEIEKELLRLQYRSAEQPAHAGEYRRRGSRIDLTLRPASFADETRPAQSLTISTDEHSITALSDDAGKDVPIARLEPLLIGSVFPIHGEDRIIVAPEDVPPLLPAALKAVEDRHFDTHHGVDFSAILRAVWVNLKAGGIEQGGSTLTQQLVKSYFLDSRQTLGRKLQEAVMAMALERRFTKRDLMNAYINEIFLAQDGSRAVHGFGLASQFYFGKPLAELDIAEVALLVGLARGPSYYDPRRRPERALARRNLVLKEMSAQRVIKDSEAREAAKLSLGVVARSAGGYYPAYLDFVRRTLRRDYHEDDLTKAGLRIFTSLDPRAQEQAEQTLERELTRLDRARKLKPGQSPLDGSVVITAPQSGDVIAIVGGRRMVYSGFNRALDAARPMGSLVKPFIYLTALETGQYHAATVVQDEPVEIQLSRNRIWKPENFTRQSYGPVPLVRALAESLNLATVHVGVQVGVPKVAETLRRFGFERKPREVPALLLGSLDVTPLDAAQLYNSLANGGFRAPLRAVRAVISADGKPLKAFPLEVTQVAEADAVYELDRMMTQVMQHGTGRAAYSFLPPELVVAGKSGTSSDMRDSWFAGFSGGHVVVVWIGYDDNRPTGLTGSSGALPVWSRIMAGLSTSSWNAAMPESLKEARIEYSTGLAAEVGCAEDVISVAVPVNVELPVKPECDSTGINGVIERAGEWLRDIIH